MVARFWLALALFATLTCCVVAQALGQTNLSLDEQIVAFVRFIEWPKGREPDPLTICQPAGERKLDVGGEKIRGITLSVVAISGERDSGPCNAFVSQTHSIDSIKHWIQVFQGRTVITVGAGADICRFGGGICFVRDPVSNRDRHSLNFEVLARYGFRVSAHLFQASRVAKPS